MKKHNVKNRVRQSRRQQRRERKNRKRIERLASCRASMLLPSHQPATFEEFCNLAERQARPGDRLRVVYVSGTMALAFGIENSDEFQPISAELIRGEGVT